MSTTKATTENRNIFGSNLQTLISRISYYRLYLILTVTPL